MMPRLIGILAVLAVFGIVGGAGSAWYFFTGRYNIAATEPHWPIVREAIDRVYRSSVRHHAAGIAAPAFDETVIAAGAEHYGVECARCHGVPGGDQPDWALGQRPKAPHLARDGTDFTTAEVFWLVENGVKLTGMPAFAEVFTEEEIWSLAAVVEALPDMSADEYAALLEESEEEVRAEDDPVDEPAMVIGMGAVSFDEPEVTIEVGQTVLWRNTSDAQHTVTADPGAAVEADHVELPEGAEPFNSGMLEPGEEWSHTFDTPGRYRYFCIPHEVTGMVAEIIVEAAGD